MPKYLIIGCIGTDHIIFPDGRTETHAGGDAYYAAAGARIWSSDVGIAAVIPKNYPQELIDKLSRAGIDVSGIIRTNLKMGLEGTIEYKDDGSRVLGAAKGILKFLQDHLPGVLALVANPYWEKVSAQPELIPESYMQAEAVFLASMAYSNQAKALRIFDGKAAHIVLDPPPLMPWVKRGTPPKELADLSRVSAVLPSEQEAYEYFGDGIAPDSAAEKFFSMGAQCVVYKMGGHGARVYGKGNQAVHVPVYRTKAVDPTGAGDSFGGGFLVGLAETGDPVKAACYGAVSASFIIEGYGADYALGVTRDQAEDRLKKLLEMLQLPNG